MTPISTTSPPKKPAIASDEALRIARLEAEKAYRDLSDFRVIVALERDGWHVDYELKNPNLNGGGPHFVIDAADGRVLWRRYEQ